MKIEITRECALVAIAAYVAGLMIGDFVEGTLALLLIVLILWAVKDFVGRLSNNSGKNCGNGDSALQNSSDEISIPLRSLKDNERRVVECLHEFGEMTQVELSARTGIPKSTLSRILRSLEEGGLLRDTATE
ncbi:Winged helix-turn-helix DNA-binding [Geoglobus ahangari]|uniref:Winged helix-turn-helix DNA-binding n=1 Tax=Geoglobus ahangari TaxID=113653 RepID=A0A0F7IEY2_9EURY|nr:winged helix-turn-helix transcriptional regulator [Geoglobus ahangari]AKG91254.1 Winged helix-turn-helix DNA-binding [Geoglobus ahangari]